MVNRLLSFDKFSVFSSLTLDHCSISSSVVLTVYFSNAGQSCLAESEGSLNIGCVQSFTVPLPCVCLFFTFYL